jgi:ankyrin repeat protein
MNNNPNIDTTTSYSYYYTSGNKPKLSNLLQDKDLRINFETWLLDTYCQNHDLSKEFRWNCEVIGLLCKTKSLDQNLSSSEAEKEDAILAKLINKTTSSLEEKTIIKIAKIFFSNPQNYSESFKNYFSEKNYIPDSLDTILLHTKNATLPITCEILLEKMLKFNRLEEIFQKAVTHNSVAMLKTIQQKKPVEFNYMMKYACSLNGTEVPYLTELLLWFLQEVKIGSNENLNKISRDETKSMLTFLAESFPKEFADSLVTQNKNGNTPIHLATFIDREILEFLLKLCTKKIADVMKIQNANRETPIHTAVKRGDVEIIHFLAQFCPNEFKTALTT